MTDNVMESQGAVLKMGNGASPEVFNTVMGVRGIDGPNGSASVIDASTLASTAREKMMGLPDEGQLTIDLNFWRKDTNGQQAMQTARTARTKKNFKIELTDSPKTIASFSAFVTGFSIGIAVDELVQAQATLEITGPVTFA